MDKCTAVHFYGIEIEECQGDMQLVHTERTTLGQKIMYFACEDCNQMFFEAE